MKHGWHLVKSRYTSLSQRLDAPIWKPCKRKLPVRVISLSRGRQPQFGESRGIKPRYNQKGNVLTSTRAQSPELCLHKLDPWLTLLRLDGQHGRRGTIVPKLCRIMVLLGRTRRIFGDLDLS